MRTLLVAFAFCICFSQIQAQIEKDKALHFLGGGLFGLAGAGIAKEISKGDRWWTFAGAVGGSALVGLGKEAIDSGQSGNSWDNEDVLATILGGITVGVAIDLFTDHERAAKRRQRSVSSSITFADGNQSYMVLMQHSQPPNLLTLSFSKRTLQEVGLQ